MRDRTIWKFYGAFHGRFKRAQSVQGKAMVVKMQLLNKTDVKEMDVITRAGVAGS